MSWNVQTFGGGGIYISTSGNSSEKTNYGKETVSKINCSSSLGLNGTAVNGKVDAGGSITATDVTAHSLDAGGSITVVGSKISNKVDAGGSVTANRCEILGNVDAGGSVDLDECPNIQSVSAGNHVTLRQSAVQGNVSARSDVTVENSKIDGKLACSSNHLIIEGSKLIQLTYAVLVEFLSEAGWYL